VKDVSLQPTMLIYLDNESSKKGHPNVNFARELLELFTLGVGNYTEPDIFAMANAWTGYAVDYYPSAGPPVMRFYPNNHETLPSTFLGVTAAWDATGVYGTNIMDFLFAQKQSVAAKFIAKKMFEFLAYENPTQSIVDALATTFITSGFSIEALVRAILVSDAFYSTTAMQGRLRSPVEWFVAVMRTTQLTVVDAYPEGSNISLGQELLNPPNVAGWKLNSYWISTACFWAKGAVVDGFGWRLHARATSINGQPPVAVWVPIIEQFTQNSPTATAPQVAQAAFDAAGLVSVSTKTRSAIEAFLNQVLQNNDRWFTRAGLLQALLMSPDFQLA
jgi:uncharacterized protein (DUF1800 family)